MNYKSHIRFINTHPKGNGCHNDVCFLVEKIILVLDTYVGIESGMVRCCLKAVNTQQLGNLLHLFTTQAIDDSRFPFVLFQKSDQLFFCFFFWPHLIVEVMAVKRGDKDIGLLHLKILLDVKLDFRCGCSGECDDRHIAKLGDHGLYLAVLRPEVMTPLGDAVCFINGDKRHVYFLEKSNIFFFIKGFGCYVQKFDRPAYTILL